MLTKISGVFVKIAYANDADVARVAELFPALIAKARRLSGSAS